MNTTKKDFTQYIHATNSTGSNKASSYILALDWLCKMLQLKPFNFDDCQNIWMVTSFDRLHELYLFVLSESKKGDSSAWNIKGIPKSYLQKGYCSAALKFLQEFLVEYSFEQKLLSTFNSHKGNESEIVKKLKFRIKYPNYLTDGLDKKQGEEIVRSVKVRINQNVFRKIILEIYNQSCCITGLNIPEVVRASHIIPWAEDLNKRLDPRNGLCLSATYDAAFDRNLISLDNDYRIILSKNITDYYTNESVKEYFINKEGTKVTLPTSYLPHKGYLENHRSKGNF
ncbi:MAG TPA: HNH endonuclease [Aeromonadales bacterium]|nr:HNH endonuclease [Aeromonadales bacterium]